MSEVQTILDEFRRVWSGDPFHGPPIRDVLAGVDARAAFSRPLAGVHSIAEIALHIATWEEVIRRRLGGEAIDQLPDDQDWLAAGEGSEARWDAIRRRVTEAHAELERDMEALPDARLDDPAPARDYDVRFMLHGALHHSLYHAGQIALLGKAAAAGIR
jgi:uncharacterized damage-inducible protein DinB